MARLREHEGDEREAVIAARAHIAASAREYAHLLDACNESPWREPWSAKADAIDRGEPLEVASWEIARHVPGIRALPHRYFILYADGTITPTDSPAIRE